MGFLVQSSCLGKLCTVFGPKAATHPVKDGPANGILLHAIAQFPPTVFATKRLAEQAIARTVKYGSEKGFGFNVGDYTIITERQLADHIESLDRRKRKKA